MPEAARRELEEETGQSDFSLVRELGVTEHVFDEGDRHETHERHFFLFDAGADLPERWSHFAEEAFWFEFEWVPLADGPQLAGHQHELLHALAPRPPTFIAGRPTLFLTAPEHAWREIVRGSGINGIVNPQLTFTVTALRRGGQSFDIDNLAKPVLEVVAPSPATVWVIVRTGEPEGVLVDEAEPPAPERVHTWFEVREPRRRSVRRLGPLEETKDMTTLGDEDAPLGLELAFDAGDERVGDFGFGGPIKQLIDGLGTVLGTYQAGARDYRIRELRIRRGERPGNAGVRVRIWRLESSPL